MMKEVIAMRIPALIAAFITLLFPAAAWSETSANATQLEVVKATLVSEYAAIQPGTPVQLGVLLEPQPEWHTYWENPGDAGMPTSLQWKLPEGFKANAIDWPAPERIAEGTLLTHAYHESVFLPVTINTPVTTLDPSKEYRFNVKATWLVCKDICIPESAELSLSLPVSDSLPVKTQNANLFADHRNTHAAKVIRDKVGYQADTSHITLFIPLTAIGSDQITEAAFFPRQFNVYEYAAKQETTIADGMLQLKIRRSLEAPKDGSSGVLSVTTEDQGIKHLDITLDASGPLVSAMGIGDMPATTPVTTAGETTSLGLLTYLFLALAGGVILNLMPCVLPVLSLKTLAIAKKADKNPVMVRKLGIAYTAGILVSFAIITSILIGLRQSGEAIGWGYQMQSPAFIGFLIYLLFLIGLNLSGLFDLPVLFGSKAAATKDDSTSGSFYTGILATAVATPCTAPFMATAVGAALTMPPLEALLVFEFLGLGLALPFLLVSFFPAALRFLPKPGPWMERFKQFLAFPMYASVIWLIWVLVLQTGPSGAAIVMTGMLGLVMVVWLHHFFSGKHDSYRIIAVIAGIAIITLSLPMLEHMQDSRTSEDMADQYHVNEVAFTPETLESMRRDGKAIFLDATAAWCLTCQLNARVAIHTANTMQLFKEKDITLMIADWTRANSDITELLGSFGHKGVPLYVYYPPDNGQPVVLPQLLTEDIIKTTITP
jgi:thiol:disulfide interchange protein/DsbC/DsbD-like thiol-disulfide interchange protein